MPWWTNYLIVAGWSWMLFYFISELGWKKALAIIATMIIILAINFGLGAGAPR